MFRLLNRLLVGWNIQANRRALKGATCPHDNVKYHKEVGAWSEPKPHPHPRYAATLKIRDRETRETVTCLVCGVDIFRQTSRDIDDANETAKCAT